MGARGSSQHDMIDEELANEISSANKAVILSEYGYADQAGSLSRMNKDERAKVMLEMTSFQLLRVLMEMSESNRLDAETHMREHAESMACRYEWETTTTMRNSEVDDDVHVHRYRNVVLNGLNGTYVEENAARDLIMDMTGETASRLVGTLQYLDPPARKNLDEFVKNNEEYITNSKIEKTLGSDCDKPILIDSKNRQLCRFVLSMLQYMGNDAFSSSSNMRTATSVMDSLQIDESDGVRWGAIRKALNGDKGEWNSEKHGALLTTLSAVGKMETVLSHLDEAHPGIVAALEADHRAFEISMFFNNIRVSKDTVRGMSYHSMRFLKCIQDIMMDFISRPLNTSTTKDMHIKMAKVAKLRYAQSMIMAKQIGIEEGVMSVKEQTQFMNNACPRTKQLLKLAIDSVKYGNMVPGVDNRGEHNDDHSSVWWMSHHTGSGLGF